jgi:hypothetical protein
MKKYLLTTAAGAALLAGVAALALQLADCGGPQRKTERCNANVVPLRLSDSNTGVEFVMQWDDASKKLLFDGQAICHDKPKRFPFNSGYITDVSDVVPAPKRPDQYSFDVGTIGDLGVSSNSMKQDGRLHYGIQWDDSKERFMIEKRPTSRQEELFQFFVDIPTSFNSRLDLMDTRR